MHCRLSPKGGAAMAGAPNNQAQRSSGAVPELIPARMLNEFTYCPRLAYLEWTQQEWADNVETLEGSYAHRRVDRDDGPRVRLHRRSVQLSSVELGVTAVIDLVERESGSARPVDYKRGRKPPIADGAWEPERVQLCIQGLLLREHGLDCNEGLIYYVASKEKVRIRFTPALVARTLELLAAMRCTLAAGHLPPPLEDSPKCPRCSLVQICLPEETRFLTRGEGEVRGLAVADPSTYPLVVQDPRAKVRLDGDRYRVTLSEGEETAARAAEVSQMVLMGGAACTEPVLQDCCRRGVPILHMSGTGWLVGVTTGILHKNVELRAEQYAAARDHAQSLAIARRLVTAKIQNARVLLRRNGQPAERALALLQGYAQRALLASDDEELFGVEGVAAKVYFESFSTMLKTGPGPLRAFDFERRSKRPPADAVNALLSFAYSLLTKDWVVTLLAIGLDPYMGFYHRPRYGKPALALDLMEPFRSVIAESVVVNAVNNGEVAERDFTPRLGGVLLAPGGRRRFIEAYERRMAQEIRHPVFGYRCTYRRIFEVEARLLARHLMGEIPSYEPLRIR